MGKTKKNYIPFMAGMATMVLLACLISASLAEEEAPAAQPQAESQVRVQAGDLRLACGEAGVALFGVERVAPGEKLKAENGAEIPAVLTYTDEKGEVHHYVEAGMIGDILDVAVGVTYHEDINCVDFGAKPFLNDKGEQQIKAHTGEPIWFTGRIKCDIGYNLTRGEDGEWVGYADGTTGNGTRRLPRSEVPEMPAEERAEMEAIWEENRREAPMKPEYGVTFGMYTEEDPAKVDLASWSGTALERQVFRNDDKFSTTITRRFAFTPYLGEYAVITIENIGDEDACIAVRRPCTVGNEGGESFTHNVRVPAGQKLMRAFRVNEELPLENQLELIASSFTDGEIELALTAEQYRFGK